MLRLHSPSTHLGELSQERGAATLSLADVGVFDCDWRQPVNGSARLRNHIAYLSLTPQPRDIRVAAQDVGRPLAPVSSVGIFPAGQELQARLGGGRQRLLLCRLSPKGFDAVLDRPMHWHAANREAALPLASPDVRQLLTRMAQEVLAPGMASQALLEALCQALVIEIARNVEASTASPTASATTGKLSAWQMRRLQDRLADRPDHPPTLDELARLCGVSPRHLMRLFKASKGQTLHQWMAAQQMARARELLSCSDRPLKAIAAQIGFQHASSFTAAFTRACGESPSVYRARTWQRRS